MLTLFEEKTNASDETPMHNAVVQRQTTGTEVLIVTPPLFHFFLDFCVTCPRR